MFRTSVLNPAVVRLTALAVALTLACHTAEAQVKPFKVTGGGTVPDGMSVLGEESAYTSAGNATLLGKYTGGGTFRVFPLVPGTFDAVTTFVAANGDELAGTFGNTDNGAEEVGEFQLFDAGGGKVFGVFLAEFNPVPLLSTGRFADVIDGSLIMVAVTEPFVPVIDDDGFTPPFDYTWEGEGWLEFKKGP